jgi:hypothetical protein
MRFHFPSECQSQQRRAILLFPEASRLPFSSSLHTASDVVGSLLDPISRILEPVCNRPASTSSCTLKGFTDTASKSSHDSSNRVCNAAQSITDGGRDEFSSCCRTGVLLADGHRGGWVAEKWFGLAGGRLMTIKLSTVENLNFVLRLS